METGVSPEQDRPTQHRWRRTLPGITLLAIVVVAQISYSAIALAILVVLLSVGAAYAIASGGQSRDEEPSSQVETDRTWARDVLARPLWVEVSASSIEWLTFPLAVVVATLPEGALAAFSLLTIASVMVVLVLVAGSLAIAMALWERRNARRILASATS